jgi:hypothetical protein
VGIEGTVITTKKADLIFPFFGLAENVFERYLLYVTSTSEGG